MIEETIDKYLTESVRPATKAEIDKFMKGKVKIKKSSAEYGKEGLSWYVTDESGNLYLQRDGKLTLGAGGDGYFKSEQEAKKAFDTFMKR